MRRQAGPGNDINAGSPGFQKAPTRGLPAWSPGELNPAEPSACQVSVVFEPVLVAVAVDEDGRRQIVAIEPANRESRSSWRDFRTPPTIPPGLVHLERWRNLLSRTDSPAEGGRFEPSVPLRIGDALERPGLGGPAVRIPLAPPAGPSHHINSAAAE